MRFTALTTLFLGAALRVAAQTADPSVVASIISKLEGIPGSAEQFNQFSGREVRSSLPLLTESSLTILPSTFLTSMKE